MPTIACVLRSGGIYDERWVYRLQRNVSYLAPPHRFVCLTDVAVGCESIPLPEGWPGWWSKICLFKPGIFEGRVLYLDLDVLVVGPLDPLFDGTGLVLAADTWKASRGWMGAVSSAVMAFDADGDTDIYDRFEPSVMERLRSDQDWIAEMRPAAATFPSGLAVSYKGDCRSEKRMPRGARVIACHGRPKPPGIGDAWFRQRWLADGGWIDEPDPAPRRRRAAR